MTAPFVGLPTVGGAGCAYGGDIDQPSCGQSPVMHVLVETKPWGVVALSACGDHLDIARHAGAFIREHPHGAGCDTVDCWGVL